VNILLFGIAGATKSSFVNSILTMLGKEDKIVTVAPVGGTARHQTTKLVRYELDKQLPGLEVNLFDTWGLTQKTYQENELEFMLDGSLPVNWNMEDNVQYNCQKLRQFENTAALRRIHSVIFFIPQAVITDPNQEPSRALVRRFYAKINQHGNSPQN
jgi:predicted GTPase